MTTLRGRSRPSWRVTPLFVFAAVLALTLLLSALVAYFVAAQQRARFEREVATLDATLNRRLDSYLNLMVSSSALWSTGIDIDRGTFGRYVRDLNPAQRLPGALGLGFARRVPPELLATFEADQRRSVPGYAVRPRSGGVTIPVVYLFPDNPTNHSALGYDTASEPTRRAALAQAAQTGLPTMSGRVTLFVDADNPQASAVMLFSPVRRGGAIYGYVILPLRISDLIDSLSAAPGGTGSPPFALQISDGDSLLYQSPTTDSQRAAFQDTSQLAVAGRVWTITHTAPASFGRDSAVLLPWLVLVAGTLIGLNIALLFRAQVRARVQAEEISHSLSLSRSSLERSRAEFEAIFRAIQDTAVFTDLGGTVLYANDALETHFRVRPEELRGHNIARLHADGRLSRSAERVTTVYRRQGGELFYGEMQRSAVKGERGELLGQLEVIHNITERLEAERALKAGERRSKGVLEAVPFPLWVTSPSGEVTYQSARYAQTFGAALLAELLHPDDQAAFTAAWQRAQPQAQVLSLELRLLAGGVYRAFNLVAAPILSAPTRISEWVFSASDVHDRLQAERLALESESRARGVIEGMPQIVWLADAGGAFLSLNRRWYDYVGNTATQMAAPEHDENDFLAALHPDDRPDFVRLWAQARASGQLFEVQHRLLGQHGSYRTFMTRGVAMFSGPGQPPQWVGTSTDIDDQVYAERSSRLLASISGQLIGGEAIGGESWESGVPGLRASLSLINERLAVLSALWVRRGDQLSSQISQVRGHARELTLLSQPEVRQAAEQALSGQSAVVLEGQMLHGSNLSGLLLTPLGNQRASPGDEGTLLALGFRQPLQDRDLELAQELSGRLGTALDSARLSRRIREAQLELQDLNASLEERVTQRTAELEEANSELEAFSYSVSHDLRTPLRHIMGFAELLQKDQGDQMSVRGQRYMGIISQAAGRMGQLIDDLLEFSRMGRQELRREDVPLDALMAGVVAELQLTSPGRETEWAIGELPPVQGDASLLRQVMLNVLGNAAKYSAKVAQPRVSVRAEVQGGEVVLEVRDNGVGFDPRYAEKLFGVFQRLHTQGEFEGSGIGLANVRRIVLRHGGRVWAESEPGQGAAFFVALPLQQPAPGELAVLPSVSEETEAQSG